MLTVHTCVDCMWTACELTINHMDHNAGAARRRRLARVVPGVRGLSIRNAQPVEDVEKRN